MKYIFLTILYVISTFAFCHGFSTFSIAFINKPLKKPQIYYTFIFFFINIIVFKLYGMLQLGLLTNWLIFTLIAFLEACIILKAKPSISAFLALQAGLCGLSANLLQRAFISLILNVPLRSVAELNSIANSISVIASFFVYYAVCLYYSKDNQIKPLRHLLQTPIHFYSLLFTMGVLMIYLLLQNFLYISGTNNIPIKLWSMLSCTYMSFGLLWSMKYAVRFSYLYYLDDQNIILRQVLYDSQNEEEHLREANYYDTLTNTLNRRSGDKELNHIINSNIDFHLCVIDLDGLKYVNDNFGHNFGDLYITSIAKLLKENCRQNKDILFRYGGDEFIIAFVEMPEKEIKQRFNHILEKIKILNESSDFKMSISFGISPPSNLTLFERFEQADKLMYEMKNKHKMQNPNLIRK